MGKTRSVYYFISIDAAKYMLKIIKEIFPEVQFYCEENRISFIGIGLYGISVNDFILSKKSVVVGFKMEHISQKGAEKKDVIAYL